MHKHDSTHALLVMRREVQWCTYTCAYPLHVLRVDAVDGFEHLLAERQNVALALSTSRTEQPKSAKLHEFVCEGGTGAHLHDEGLELEGDIRLPRGNV